MEMENVSSPSLGDQNRSSDYIETTSANPQEEQPDDNRDEDAGISLIKVDIFFLMLFKFLWTFRGAS